MPFSFTFKKRFTRFIIFITAIFAIPYIPALIFSAISNEPAWVLFIALTGLPWISICLHNILRLKLRNWKHCWRIFELIYSLVEFAGLLTLVIFTAPVIGEIDLDIYAFFSLFTVVLLAVQGISVFGSLLDVWALGSAGLRQPYNLSLGPLDGNEDRPIEIFGTQTWRKRYDSDGSWILWARGTGAVLCLVLSIILTFYALCYQPVRSLHANRTPSKYYWSATQMVGGPPPNVTVVFPEDFDEPKLNLTGSPTGLSQPLTSAYCAEGSLWLEWKPSRTSTVSSLLNAASCYMPQWSVSPDWLYRRQELVYVLNFPPTINASSLVSFYVMNTADMGDINTILRATQGALIWPGARLLALGSISQLEPLSNPAAAAFGMLRSAPHIVYNILSTSQDPFPPTLNNNHSASLRIVFDVVTTDVFVEQASSENTVLTGFSFIGGIWTFLNGLYGFIFGCTMTFVLFGIKPLSVYGLVHFFSSPKPGLYLNQNDELGPGDEARTIRMLRQHLLDVGDDDSTQRPSDTTSEENVEKGTTQEPTRVEQAPLLAQS